MPLVTPNILFIQADQMAAPVLPFYGGPVVKAPRMSELADGGVVFENAYCNSPLCAPSRFSMLSGELPSTIGAYDNAAEFSAARPTFVHALGLMGYRTVLSGKMHFVGPDQLHGFEERLTSDIYPADFGWTPNWDQPDVHQDFFHSVASVVEAGICRRSLQIDFDDETAFHAVRKIYDMARDGDDRPFFLLASFSHPHDPYTITKAYWDRYDDAEIDMPSVPPIPVAEQDPHSRRLARNFGIGRYDLNARRVRAARHAYYGAIGYIDDKVGELLDALDATGLGDTTVVILTSDHGDMLGERGLWYKMCFYEWAARVPLVVHAPGRFAPHRVAENVSLLDLFPTLIDLGGGDAASAGIAEVTRALPGSSLFGKLEGNGGGGPDEVFGEYFGEGALGPLVMIRRGRYKYIVGEGSPPQLFDLAADPRELENLVGQVAHAEVESAWAAAAAERWDLAALKARVVASQRRRRLIDRAGKMGRYRPWDFQPFFDASRQYARNVGDILGDRERRARLPYSAKRPPDGGG